MNIREHEREFYGLHPMVRRNTVADAGRFGGHYGALYWALGAYFDGIGRPRSSPNPIVYWEHWKCEVTGGGDRPYRPVHGALWSWACAIAEREWETAAGACLLQA